MENNKLPTVKFLRENGFDVEITHTRRFKIVELDKMTGKIVTRHLLSSWEYAKGENRLAEFLPKGGLTEMYVTDTTIKDSPTFYVKSVCSTKDNYNKKIGVSKCIARMVDFMRVCDGKDGFTNRLQF